MSFIKNFFSEKTAQTSQETNKPKKEAQQIVSTNTTKNKIEPNTTKKSNEVFIPRKIIVDTKLTIILIENTNEVANEKDKLEKIVKSLVTTGYVCIINYGSTVREGTVVEARMFKSSDILCNENIGDDTCLFDALMALEKVIEENYNKITESEYKKIRIKNVDIIGIGKCVDNCSITTGQMAIESFYKVASHNNVTTKYFCLSEESFVGAAAIGFHSIGAIPRNYM